MRFVGGAPGRIAALTQADSFKDVEPVLRALNAEWRRYRGFRLLRAQLLDRVRDAVTSCASTPDAYRAALAWLSRHGEAGSPRSPLPRR